MKKINLSEPKRRYYSDECNINICPECGSILIEESCTILISAKSDSDQSEFMTNLSGSKFCLKCPVVVFDNEKVNQAARFGLRQSKSIKYIIAGIINFDSIPDDKKHLEIGCDDNPIPLVQFLPDLYNQPNFLNKKQGRNEQCPCGSGKKYKKCCGK
jgi:hypothetical protein